MQTRVSQIVIRPDNEKSARRDGRQGGDIRGDLPFCGAGQVVRQVQPPHIERHVPGIVQLDPVVVLPLRVCHILGIGGEKLVDYDGNLCRLRPARHQDKRR